jgi:hypothetical protein
MSIISINLKTAVEKNNFLKIYVEEEKEDKPITTGNQEHKELEESSVVQHVLCTLGSETEKEREK